MKTAKTAVAPPSMPCPFVGCGGTMEFNNSQRVLLYWEDEGEVSAEYVCLTDDDHVVYLVNDGNYVDTPD